MQVRAFRLKDITCSATDLKRRVCVKCRYNQVQCNSTTLASLAVHLIALRLLTMSANEVGGAARPAA